MPQLLLRISVLCYWEHQAPLCLKMEWFCNGIWKFTRICNGMSDQGGWVTFHPWVRGNYWISVGSCCLATSCTCWNTLYLEWNILGDEEGRVEGGRPHLAYLTPSPSPHTGQRYLPSGNMYGMNDQVKLLKLPASFSSSSGGHILFSLVQLFDRHLCPCL